MQLIRFSIIRYLIYTVAVLFSLFAYSDGDLSPSTDSSVSFNPLNKTSIEKYQRLVNTYQNKIEQLEYQQGSYSSELSQELLNLADIFQKYGKHEKAIEVLKRALHLTRINDGLYSLSQSVVIKKLITSLAERKKWEQVNKRVIYLNWVYQQNFDDNALETLEVKLMTANWYLKSYWLKRSDHPVVDLVQGHIHFRKALNIINQTYGETSEKALDILDDISWVNYLIAVTPISSLSNANQAISQTSLGNDATLVGNTMYGMKRRSFTLGLDYLEQELKIYQNKPKANHVKLTHIKLKQADWHLLYGRRNQASSLYQEAYQYALENITDKGEVDMIFAMPVAIPDNPSINFITITKQPASIKNYTRNYVHASLDITRYGHPKNISIVSSNIESSATKSSVIRTLREITFRPRLDDGNLAPIEQVQMHIFP